MAEQEKTKKENKKLEKIAAVVLVIIIIISTFYLFLFYIQNPQSIQETKYAKYFTNITASAAYELINNSIYLTIIDCRSLEGCGYCSFKNEGHIKGAELNSNAKTLYNWSEDILVYSKNGTAGASFCQELINKVYGKIYNLDGGINAWNELKYPLVYGSQ
jgi:rhodanese-related sulfurtransferase